jgi:aminoglycoside 2''-phosphotransferase
LYNRAGGRLCGAIDWGMAGLGDPAADLGWLLQIYAGVLVRRLFLVYPEAGGLLPRARFYTQALELEWMMRGLAGGGTFWFGAHLAGARDLLQDGAVN